MDWGTGLVPHRQLLPLRRVGLRFCYDDVPEGGVTMAPKDALEQLLIDEKEAFPRGVPYDTNNWEDWMRAQFSLLLSVDSVDSETRISPVSVGVRPANIPSVETKTIGELIDELTITNIKIFAMEDLKREAPREAVAIVADLARKIQACNDQRAALKNAITRRLEPGGREDVKVKT